MEYEIKEMKIGKRMRRWKDKKIRESGMATGGVKKSLQEVVLLICCQPYPKECTPTRSHLKIIPNLNDWIGKVYLSERGTFLLMFAFLVPCSFSFCNDPPRHRAAEAC